MQKYRNRNGRRIAILFKKVSGSRLIWLSRRSRRTLRTWPSNCRKSKRRAWRERERLRERESSKAKDKEICFGLRTIPDKTSHPNFHHVQSIEYAKHADQPQACSKHTGKKDECGRKRRKMRNVRTVSARRKRNKQKIGKSGFVRGGFG